MAVMGYGPGHVGDGPSTIGRNSATAVQFPEAPIRTALHGPGGLATQLGALEQTAKDLADKIQPLLSNKAEPSLPRQVKERGSESEMTHALGLLSDAVADVEGLLRSLINRLEI